MDLLHHACHVQFVLQYYKLVAGAERVLPFAYVLQCSVDREFQVVEVDWLGDKVEGTSVHSNPDVLHVTVSGYNDSPYIRCYIRNSVKKCEAIHLGHIYVRQNHVDALVRVERFQCFDTVVGENKLVDTGSYVSAHTLQHEGFEIRLIVDYENLVLLRRFSHCHSSPL